MAEYGVVEDSIPLQASRVILKQTQASHLQPASHWSPSVYNIKPVSLSIELLVGVIMTSSSFSTFHVMSTFA